MHDEEAIAARYARVAGVLDERSRRAVAASEAITLGWGGSTAVARATGLSRQAIRLGIAELTGTMPSAAPGRIRRPGGGRKKTVDRDPTVSDDLERLVDPATRGDPESPLRWTCKSVRTLAATLGELGHQVSHQWVAAALRDRGYGLQANRKTREGAGHPDRDAQFAHLNAVATTFLAAGDPVISVDTKKKEPGGDFKNGGREWQPVGVPAEVRPMASTIGAKTPVGSTSGSITTRRRSPWRVSVAGGKVPGGYTTPRHTGC